MDLQLCKIKIFYIKNFHGYYRLSWQTRKTNIIFCTLYFNKAKVKKVRY